MAHVPGRVLALDHGSRRIGLAISDELGLTAQGLPTLVRKNRSHDLEALKRTITERQVKLVVIGNPLHMSGKSGSQSQEAIRFAKSIMKHCRVEVKLWDERLTTREATYILRQSNMGIKKRKAAVDRLSATIILQNYLDHLAGDNPSVSFLGV